jgi:hypothetical protein
MGSRSNRSRVGIGHKTESLEQGYQCLPCYVKVDFLYITSGHWDVGRQWLAKRQRCSVHFHTQPKLTGNGDYVGLFRGRCGDDERCRAWGMRKVASELFFAMLRSKTEVARGEVRGKEMDDGKARNTALVCVCSCWDTRGAEDGPGSVGITFHRGDNGTRKMFIILRSGGKT